MVESTSKTFYREKPGNCFLQMDLIFSLTYTCAACHTAWNSAGAGLENCMWISYDMHDPNFLIDSGLFNLRIDRRPLSC
jgi:hypothetical protein